jgi:N-acetylglutamate synthase-like GNAT family acetyltransferase
MHLPAEQIAAGLVRVAERDGALAGFSVLLKPSMGRCELDGLFVDPDQMGAGVGRRLVEDATRIAQAQHATAIDVVANPQAGAFYARVGFVASGQATTRFGVAHGCRCACACNARAAVATVGT